MRTLCKDSSQELGRAPTNEQNRFTDAENKPIFCQMGEALRAGRVKKVKEDSPWAGFQLDWLLYLGSP